MAANDPHFANTKLLLHMEDAGLSDVLAHTVTKAGNVTRSGAQAKFGGYSAYFDGTGDYLSVATSVDFALGSGDFTVEGWIYPQATANLYPTLIERQGGSWAANEWSIAVDHTSAANKYSVWIYNINSASPAITSTNNVAYDSWHHVALSRTGNTWRLFVDGVLEGSATSSAALTGTSSEPLRIGNQYLGYMDDLRVTKGHSRYPSDSSFTPPSAAFPDYDRYLAGSLTESVSLTDWQIQAQRVDTNAVINEQTVTGATFELPLMISLAGYTGPVWLIGRPKVGAIWTPNTPKAVGDYAFPSAPETTPYLFAATSISDAYLASVKLLLSMDGANDGTTFTDATGKAVTRAGNVATKTGTKKFGTASAYFDGSGDYLATATSADFAFGSGDFTVEAWVYPQSTAHSYPSVVYRSATWGANEWNISVDHTSAAGKYSVFCYNVSSAGNPVLVSSSSIVYDAWHHVALTREGNVWRLFVDGVLEDSDTISAALTGASSEPFNIGSGYLGYIDDVRVTKGAARYANTFTPPDAAFVYGTGTTEPTWPTTPGNTVVDGGVTWACKGRMVQPVMHGPLIPSI